MQIKKTCPLAGKTIRITSGPYEGNDFVVEDWACNVFEGLAWEMRMNNPAILDYLVGHNFELSGAEHSYMGTAMYGKVGLYGKVVRWEEIEVPDERREDVSETCS